MLDYGIKELYEVIFRANQRTIIGKKQFVPQQPIMTFDNLQIGQISETVIPKYARGGKGNPPLVIWQDRQDVTFTLTKGVINDFGLALLTNAKIIENPNSFGYLLRQNEVAQSDDKGIVRVHFPIDQNSPIFIYNQTQGSLMTSIIPEKINYETGEIQLGEKYAYSSIIIDYGFYYKKQQQNFILDANRFNTTLEVEGRFYRQSDQDGKNRTTIIRMPNARIATNINFIIGNKVPPTTFEFKMVASPGKTQFSDRSIAEFYMLEDDIDF